MKPLFNPSMLLSEHFKLSEMLASETAEQRHIPNTPRKDHIMAMQNLAVRCLEPTRQHSGSIWWVHVSCRINFRRNRHQAFQLKKQ